MLPVTGKFIVCSLKLLNRKPRSASLHTAIQEETLRKLLHKGKNTVFGKQYDFRSILRSKDPVTEFRNKVPVYTYSEMLEKWWHRTLKGDKNITWPGKIKYFALSSGTSDAASKYIPVTNEMLRSTRKVGRAQIVSLSNFQIPEITFQKSVLMLGGSISLLPHAGGCFAGDMSGISALKMPWWLSDFYYKPGKEIAKENDWQKRIELIVANAHRWDIGMICGIPSWVQILFEKVIDHYRLANIHDIWPNLKVYIHGGVSFDHYRDQFKKLLGKPLIYIETYMASEGSFGFKAEPGNKGIRLMLDAGIFYEFIRFDNRNFDQDGKLRSHPEVTSINEVEEDTSYAVVLSSCAGAWRYLIGDVISFTSVERKEIKIVGRTSQFLNLCGEHVSIENINTVIDLAAKKFRISIGEFCVAGVKHESLFAYRWYIGCDDPEVDADQLKKFLDEALCVINDDYRVERQAGAISDIIVEILPKNTFHGYLKYLRKEEAMAKFPRVMKGNSLNNWENYLKGSTEYRETKTLVKKF